MHPSPLAYVASARRCWIILGAFFWISFLEFGVQEVFPLWAISSVASGGLDWGTPQVSSMCACGKDICTCSCDHVCEGSELCQ